MYPKDLPGFELLQKMIDEGNNPAMGETLSFKLVYLELGKVIFSGVPNHNYVNPMGTVHGGWYGSILDSAMACSVISRLPANQIFTTLEYKVNMTHQIPLNQEVWAEGTSVHIGRRTAVAEGKIYDKSRKIYATASTTGLIVSKQ
ncbi:MAG: PaaI family thioesterase [Rhodobacteraceae bacterium]|nr:PaaI family thioesterase [Paracoccaceae bacterium]